MWVTLIGFIGASIVIGFVAEKIIFVRLRSVAKKTSWTWNGTEVIISAIGNFVMLWVVLAGVYTALFHIHLDPQTQYYVKRGIFILVISTVTIVCARITAGFVTLYTNRVQGLFPTTSLLTHVTNGMVYAIGVLIVLQSLGIAITPIIATLGIGGLAVALALRDTLENLFSGLHIIASKKIKPGDYIRLESNQTGKVQDISWRNTTILDSSNSTIVIPNAKIASTIITNYSLAQEPVGVPIDVRVSYSSDLQQVEHVSREVALQVLRDHANEEKLDEESVPTLYFHTFDSSTINYTVTLYTRDIDQQPLLKHLFIQQLHERFKQEQIEFK